MTDTGLSNSDMELIVATVAECGSVQQLLLFGSRAKGTHKMGSDVDLAVKGDSLTYDDVVRLAGELNENKPLPYMFDVVDYSHLDNPELRDHIDRVGIQLFNREVSVNE